MSFNLAFLFSSYFLVCLGLGGLFLTDELSPWYLLLASCALCVGLWSGVMRRREILPGYLANISMLGVFAITLFSILILQAPPLQQLVQFLLALQAVKLLGPKQGRDWLHLYLLSFFSLIAASALSTEISFGLIFIVYLFSAPWVLVLFHLKTASEAAGKDPDTESGLLKWALLRMMITINVVLFSLTLLFFISFPRVGAGFFGNPWIVGSGVTGFSDRLTLGEVAEIQKSSSVAMRVSIEQPAPLAGRKLYWRGLALDFFDGRNWQKSRSDFVQLRRMGRTYVVHGEVKKLVPPVHQKISLEPTGTPALFTLNRPVAIFGTFFNVFRDSLGNLRTTSPFPFQINYEVFSYPEESWKEEAPKKIFLQLPSLNPRIPELARQVTSGVDQDLRKARLIERYLRENYRYSLKGLPVGKEDPLTAFLFRARQGNCEYFSSALAVMLRSLGIPARVVNGYLGGEWNPYGEYYIIRQSNAHSWVEAYFSDRGWVTLDATPSLLGLSPDGFFISLSHFLDFVKLRWHSHVINFSLRDQYEILAALRRPHQWFTPDFRGLAPRRLSKSFQAGDFRRIGLATLLLAGALFALLWLRKNRRKKLFAQASTWQATERYSRFLALLKKKGIKKEPFETPDEFCGKAELQRSELAREFTDLYQKARFSSLKDTAGELQRMDQILLRLRNEGGRFSV